MPTINSCNIAAHAGSDAKYKEVGETFVTEINIAITSGWGDRAKTAWATAVIWGKPAQWMASCGKGDLVVINNAEFIVDEYKNKDGEERRAHKFVVGRNGTAFYVKKGHFKEQMADSHVGEHGQDDRRTERTSDAMSVDNGPELPF